MFNLQFQNKENEFGYRTCGNGDQSENWLVTKTLDSNETLHNVKLKIEIESQMEECEVQGGKCFKDGFELLTYNGEGEPKVPYDLKDQQNVEKEKEKARIFLNSDFTSLGNITGNATSKEHVNTIFTLNLKKFRTITFGIKSSGGCGSVIRMKVYYYVCQEMFIKSVMFKTTMSPQNGSKVVFGNCSENTAAVKKAGGLKAYCHSNGSWSTEKDVVCRCDKGYEPTTNKGCSGMLTFSDMVFCPNTIIVSEF